jgi:hypothetical protein
MVLNKQQAQALKLEISILRQVADHPNVVGYFGSYKVGDPVKIWVCILVGMCVSRNINYAYRRYG